MGALLASAGNQAHRRVRPRLLLNLIIFFLKIQKANVFLNSFILHRTGEILYAYAEPAIWFCRPPPRLAPINRVVRSPRTKMALKMNCMAANTAHSAEIPQNSRIASSSLGFSDRAILSTLTHMPPCPAGHNLDPVDDFLHKGGRAL